MLLSDVTLREGEQTSGISYGLEEKVTAGRLLDDLGIDYIQAGFPVIGEEEQTVVSTLAGQVDATITAMARAVPGDIEAVVDADADMAHIFATTQEQQLQYMIGKSREEMLERWRDAVDIAQDYGLGVRIASVDAFRTEIDHLVALYELFPDVELIGLSDTVGRRLPSEVRDMLTALDDRGCDLARTSVHFHDDLGLATANALEGARLGVGNVDVSVAGVGERAGNTPLEEFVAAWILAGKDLNLDETRLVPTCREIASVLDEKFTMRKALLGEEVYKHESGLHTGAMLEEPSVFEPFEPSRFGAERELIFGAMSGRRAAEQLLKRAGREPNDDLINELLTDLGRNGPMGLDQALKRARGI